MFKNRLTPVKSGIGLFVFICVFIIFSPVNTFAISTARNLAVSPGTVAPGSNIAITFDYMGSSSGCKTAYFATMSNQNTLRSAGTAGQSVLVNETGINIAYNINNQATVGRLSPAYGDNAWHASTVMDANIYMTVPASYSAGTYYVLLSVGDCNIYLNPNQSSINNTYAVSFTVASASSQITAQKSASPMSVCVGNNVTFCITATNTGGPYTFNIWDTVPAGLTFVGCDNSCTLSGTVVSWTITNLAASGSVTRCFWASANTVPFYELHKIFLAHNSWNPSAGKRYSVLYLLENYDSFEN